MVDPIANRQSGITALRPFDRGGQGTVVTYMQHAQSATATGREWHRGAFNFNTHHVF
jgi:hypothetical protein